MAVVASEVGRGSILSQLASQDTSAERLWFTLYNNKLDGTYYPLSTDGTEHIGWWGTTLSDAAGAISSSPYVEVQYASATSISAVKVQGDPLTGNYPVNFTIDLYNGATIVHTETVTTNASNSWFKLLDATYSATALRVTVTKISVSGQPARLITATDIPILKSSDSLKIASSAIHTISDRRMSTDILKIATPTQEGEHLTVSFSHTDAVRLTVTETSKVTNAYTALDADSRQVFAKVKITYTDLFKDETVAITASETGSNTKPSQLADGISTPAFKWFSLHENKLDGTYHPLSDNGDYSVGWWGTSLSDANGVLATPVVLTINFSARSMSLLQLAGDVLLHCYPVDFTFKAYDASNAVLGTWPVTGNALVDWSLTIPTVLNITKLEVTITKISRSNSVAKITEMYTAIVETYDADAIVSIHLLEEIGYSTGSLPIGNISANEIDITLDNSNRHFDLSNKQSSLYGLVKRNRRVEPSLGVTIGDTTEWYPLGTYWTTTWDIPKGDLTATLTARDRLELLRQTFFTTSIVYTNKTLYDLFGIILRDAGLTTSEYVLDTALQDTVVPYAWFAQMSHREALQRLAGCGIISVYCTKDGLLHVKQYLSSSATVNVVFDDDVNVFSSKYPLAVEAQVNYIEVSYAPWVASAAQPLYDYDEELSVPAGSTASATYVFSNMPVLNVTAPVITASSGITVDSYQQYAWGVIINYKNTAAASGTVTHVTVSGQMLQTRGTRSAIAQDPTLVREDGQMKQTIQHDFIQSVSYAQSLADEVLSTFKGARHDAVLDNRGHVALELGDRVTVKDADEGISADYMVARQSLIWDGSLSATTEGKKL